MKTRLAAAASAALLGALAGAGGCVENRASVETQMICFPTTDCTFTAACGAQFIGYPTVDQLVDPTGALWLLLQVANQLPNNANLSTGRVNTNDAHIDEAAFEYEGALTGKQTVGSNYYVPASGTNVISAKLSLAGAVGGTAAVPSEVLAHVRFRGYFDDGRRFETGDFPITVKVCTSGCAPSVCAIRSKDTCPPSSEGQRPIVCQQ